ncbi:MAG TPA: hypothetical protein VKQ32_23285 [Polyangia bacterium]|nr:hypothetical protein [Polyangia bacterium]
MPEDSGPPVLGQLEQESVGDALARLGLAIDPAPQGKIIGRIHVVAHEVFSPRDGRLQWFNLFHRTTRPGVLGRELLLAPGQLYDEALIDESTRNIQSPLPFVVAGRQLWPPDLSSVVAIVPVRSPIPGHVDLLLVTRDLWSLRFNSDFEFQQNALTLFETSLSENNLFGWRKFLSLGFGFDQGAYHYGPTYVDPNIRGTRLTLWTSAILYGSRETGHFEGDAELASLHYPLYSLASRWGAGVDVRHLNVVTRVFQGNDLRRVDLAATPGLEQIPYEYRKRSVTVDASVVRSFGAAVIQRVTGGYLLDSRRAEVLSDFPGDAAAARLFLAEWAPTAERRSEPYVAYELFTPRYAVLRDFATFDLREYRQIGVLVRARASEGVTALGADFPALGLGATAGFGFARGGGYGSITAGASARLRHDDGSLIDQIAGLATHAATPLVDGLFRIVVEGEVDAKRADTTHTPYVLGGASPLLGYRIGELNGAGALRGYQIGEFIGNAVFAAHVELRTAPQAIASQRIGGLAFYDVGHAAASLSALVPRNDVGVGLRWLIPQLNQAVVRGDWAVPLQDGAVTRAGMPGRLSAGFQHVF